MWINRKITVEGMANMATWDELMSKEKPSKTALALAEEAHRFLDGKNRPSVILFSNSYSLSNILSQYLLNKNIGGLTVRQYIKEKAVEAWDMHDKRSKTKTSLESLGESIRSIKAGLDQNQLNFIIDNMIVFDLTRNKNGIFNDEIIDGFVDKFKDPQRLSDLGIETVLRADQSPTTEPLYYIDFTSIKDEVIDNLNPLLKASIAKLREKKLSAFYLPYLPGDLTYSTIIEMKKMIDSITAVAEVGKVAHLIVDKQQRDVREIGQFVIPTQTFSSYGESKLESLSNQVKKAHGRLFEQFRVVSETSLMQVLSVILQDKLEILDIVKSIFPNTYIKENITINMEVGPIRQAVNKLRLLLFEADYISDHAISSEMFEEYKALGKEKLFQQITKSLDRKGRYGVAAATAAVLTAIADSKKI